MANEQASVSLRGVLAGRSVHVDWLLVAITMITVAIGLATIRSTEIGADSGFFIRQLVGAIIGFGGLIFLMVLPYQIFRTYTRAIYIVMVVVLVSVLIFGVSLRGTKGWFHIGPIYLQASEVAKLTFVLSLAGYLDQRIDWPSPRALVVPLLLAFFPIGLILAEPDLSSSLVFFPVTLVMFYVAGARTLHLLAICLLGALAAGLPLVATYLDLMGNAIKDRPVLLYLAQALKGGWKGLWLLGGVCFSLTAVWWFLRRMRVYIPSLYLWTTLTLILLGAFGSIAAQRVLKDYQRKRLIAFVNPELDPLGGGYNVRQSQIAIGSGQLLGKGYGQGTQSRLGFLPSRHTDFIFSVIGEELGFIRALMVLIFYFLIIWRGFDIAAAARDRFGGLVASGFTAMFAFYALLNVGMTMGLAPVAGVPLPLVSYGGSSIVSSLFAIGLLLSVHWRRYLL